MFPQSINEFPAANDQTRLGPTEQLVTAKAHNVGSGRDRLADDRLIIQTKLIKAEQSTRTGVFVKQQSSCVSKGGKVGDRRLFRETGYPIVGRMNPKDQCRSFAQCF